MTQPTPIIPTPTAVPWTPDMGHPQAAVPMPASAPVSAPAPVSAQPIAPAQQPYQPAPQYQPPQPPAQPQYAPQPQAYAPQPPVHAQGQAQAPQPAQTQPARYAPAPAPQHQQQPHHAQHPQHAQPARVQPQMAQPPAYGQQAPQYAQAGTPQHLMQQMHGAAQGAPAFEADEPKSFIAKLLKRTPKPADLGGALPAVAASGSIFDKNFAIGGVAGLVIGAFVLPMLIGMFGGDKPDQAAFSQAQAVPLPSVNPATAAAAEGDTFIDNAIATDAP